MAIHLDPNKVISTGQSEKKQSTDLIDNGDTESTQQQEATEQSAYADTVEFTEDAHILRDVEAKLGLVSEIDHSRVERIKQAIISGEYQINTDNIADKIIQLEEQFEGK